MEQPKGCSIERLYERCWEDAATIAASEQQILAIVRALARDTMLLLLNEPYESVARVIVQEIKKNLCPDQIVWCADNHR